MRKPSVRTRVNTIAMQHMQKENRRKPSVFAGSVAGAEGLEPSARGFGVDVGTDRRRAGEGRCWAVPATSPREGGAGLVLRRIYDKKEEKTTTPFSNM